MIKLELHKALNGAKGSIHLKVALDIQEGEFLTLYGNSGAGKTSILRMIAGLLKPDYGKIVVGDRVWFDDNTSVDLRPQQRQVGMVFQDYALFPNMTVEENLKFAFSGAVDQRVIEDLVELMELDNLRHQKPQLLSGGQQQRVAIARALIQQPKVLLLDEPLSALDQDTRKKLQNYIKGIHQKFNLTTILVSHDLSEIWKLSDRVIHMQEGKVIRQGKPAELFDPGADAELVAIQQKENRIELTFLFNKETVKMKIPLAQWEAIKQK